MTDYGITPEGFERKKLDVLLSEINDAVRAVFGDNINLKPESPDGQINGVVAESNANLWELLEKSYDAFNPSAASGASLSNLVQLNGITRLPASSSRALITLTGVSGTPVPAGALVSTSDTGVLFSTEEAVTLPADVYASAVNTGQILGLANTITKIETPITGWQQCNNADDATVGTDIETDAQLRARRVKSFSTGSRSVIDAIYSIVANIPGVTQTNVLENDTNVIDANGLPPHSFKVICVGGVESEIGEAIWIKKPCGITPDGDIDVPITDSQGIDHIMRFSRPTEIPIYVVMNLSTDPDIFPSDGADLIREAIISYAEDNFPLGQDVIYSRLYTPINSVPGHQVNTLTIGTSPAPSGTVNIPIAPGEVSVFSEANIEVT